MRIGIHIEADRLFENFSKASFSMDHRNDFIQVMDGQMKFMKRFHDQIVDLSLCKQVHMLDEFIVRFCFDVEGIQKLWKLIQDNWDTSILERQNGLSDLCTIS